MPVPFAQFAMPTFQQSNPWLQGAKAAQDLYKQAVNNQYLAPLLKQQLQQQQYATQEMPIDIQQKQAVLAQQPAIQKLGEEQAQAYPGESAAKVAQDKASASLANINAQLAPQTLAIRQAELQQKLKAMPLGSINAFARIMNAPELQSLVGSNPQIASDIASGIASFSKNVRTGLYPGLPGQNGETPYTGEQTPDQASAQQQIQQQQQQQQQQPQQPQQQPQQPDSSFAGQMTQGLNNLLNTHSPALGMLPDKQVKDLVPTANDIKQQALEISDSDVDSLRADMRDVLLRKQKTAQMLNQSMFGGTLNKLFDSASSLMPVVSQYAGAAGKGKLSLDAVKSSLGENTPAYADYLKFTRTTAPLISNEMRRTLGGQATNEEQKAMDNISNPLYWDSNPLQAQQQFQYLVGLYRGDVDPVLSSRISEMQTNLKNAASGTAKQPAQPAQTSSYSQNDLEYTAKTHGISVDEVRKRLGVK